MVSAKSLGKYLRPYSKSMQSTNELKDGYNWHEAYYLYPIGVTDMRTASPDRSLENTNLYQNINWPTSAGGHADTQRSKKMTSGLSPLPYCPPCPQRLHSRKHRRRHRWPPRC